MRVNICCVRRRLAILCSRTKRTVCRSASLLALLQSNQPGTPSTGSAGVNGAEKSFERRIVGPGEVGR